MRSELVIQNKSISLTAHIRKKLYGQTYPLFGPIELTQYDVADILKGILGRKITYAPVEINEFADYLKDYPGERSEKPPTFFGSTP